jgi:hypothetical protein
MSAIRTFNVEAGLPTLDEARRLVIAEIKLAKRERTRVLNVIHGHGSSGTGGKLCVGLRKSFGLRKKEGVIKESIAARTFPFSTTQCWPCWKLCRRCAASEDKFLIL